MHMTHFCLLCYPESFIFRITLAGNCRGEIKLPPPYELELADWSKPRGLEPHLRPIVRQGADETRLCGARRTQCPLRCISRDINHIVKCIQVPRYLPSHRSGG